ncbi:MAG: hypothetical protein AAF990_10835 [Bacteroidota bacterium]
MTSDMVNLSDKLNSIELKVRQLALKLERLQSENTSLLNENNQLKTALREERNKPAIAIVPQNTVAVQERTDLEREKKLRREIDQHIKQIDKCIEWLQKS